MNSKIYTEPKFEVIRQNESNKVFFVASGASAAPSFGLGSMSSTNGAW